MYVEVLEGWRYRPGEQVSGGDADHAAPALPQIAGLLARLWTTYPEDPQTGIAAFVWLSRDAARNANWQADAAFRALLEDRLDLSGLTVRGLDAADTNEGLHGLWWDSQELQRVTFGDVGRDGVTGLSTRGVLISKLDEVSLGAMGGGPTCSLMMVDLDGLKDINDSFGHEVGDAALHRLADTLKACARDGDTVARLGGDEFAVVVCHERGLSEAEVFAAYAPALKPLIYHDDSSGRTLLLSCAWGSATLGPQIPDVRSLFARADEAMILQKGTAVARPAEIGHLAPFVPRGRRALAEELSSLLAMVREVATATDEDEFIRRAAVRVAELIGAASTTLTLTHPGGRVGYRASRHDGAWRFEMQVYPGGSSILERVWTTGEPYFSNDLINDPVASQEAVQRLELLNCLCVPLHGTNGQMRGTFFVANKLGRAPFNDHDLRLVRAFADLVAVALEKLEAFAAADMNAVLALR